ncbi:MAG: GGDEF domain-containing phosphodiesterase, partial [Hydrogenovibrio sp.]|nr:GGDEF domain-containing phosphodiesterase [Hydrogenovibrio sp.]
SKGFAYSLSSEDSFMELIKRADTAMYAAKESNDQNYAVFTPEMAEKVQGQLQLERDLHKAINNDEFEVYFQPIMESDGKKVHSLEALIRWHHPVNGLIPPNIFIPIAEESGIIHKISTIVVDQVLDFLQMLETDEVPLCRISVNISGREFNPTHIYGLMDKIRSKGLNDCFEFEMLESYLMGNAEDVISLLEEVRSTGISIAIDDFGTGYSSLSYLKKFPIDKIKIDQSLIKDIIFDSNDLAITKAVVAIARSLNLKVVAEGVETEEHSTLLSVVGIDFLQGYHFAKPMPRLEAEQYIKGYHNLA